MKTRLLVASAVLVFGMATQPAFAQLGKASSTTTSLTLEVTPNTLTVHGVTPHGTAVIFGMLRLPQKYWTGSARREFVITDDDGDGVVQVANVTIPASSVWFAADITTGATATSTPAEVELRRLDLPEQGISRSATGEVKRISVPRDFVEGLVVRPGSGVWAFTAGDGGQHDADGVVNGRVEVDPSRMRPLGNSPAPSDSLQAHDILVIIDPHTLQLFTSEVAP